MAAPCPGPGRKPMGPARMTGRIAMEGERELIGSNLDRCYKLWTTLYGGACDFDDCLENLATDLGWAGGRDLDLFEYLNSLYQHILEKDLPWSKLRDHAIKAFYAARGDNSVEISNYDPRTWDELIYDILYQNGRCEACYIKIPGGQRLHRKLAEKIAMGRTSWEEIEKIVNGSPSAPQP
jgi:hypothetical protein